MAAKCYVRVTWPDGSVLWGGMFGAWHPERDKAFVHLSLSQALRHARSVSFPGNPVVDTPLVESFRPDSEG